MGIAIEHERLVSWDGGRKEIRSACRQRKTYGVDRPDGIAPGWDGVGDRAYARRALG